MEQHGICFERRLNQTIIAQTSCLIASQTTIKMSPQQDCCGGFFVALHQKLTSERVANFQQKAKSTIQKVFRQASSPSCFPGDLLWPFHGKCLHAAHFSTAWQNVCFAKHFVASPHATVKLKAQTPRVLCL